MKKVVLGLALVLGTLVSNAQLVVNGVDLNKEAKTIEVYQSKSYLPFAFRDRLFIDYGQKGFYDFKYSFVMTQSIFDKDGRKFKRGEHIRLLNYLREQGWTALQDREYRLSGQKVWVTIYENPNLIYQEWRKKNQVTIKK